MFVQLPTRAIILTLLGVTVGINGMSIGAIALQSIVSQHNSVELMLHYFARLDDQTSLATWYSSTMFLLAAYLLWGIASDLNSIRLNNSGSLSSSSPNSKSLKHHTPALGLTFCFILLSIDKSTGFHHALIHDVLYRIPLAVLPKKIVLGCILAGLLGTILTWATSLFKHCNRWTKRIIASALVCFIGSEVGVNRIAYALWPSLPDSARSSGFLIGEQALEHLAGVLLIWGILLWGQTVQKRS